MELLFTLLLVAAVIALTPLLIWLFQLGGRPKRSGVAGAFLDGFAQTFEPQQQRVQDAKRETNKGGRENGEPPAQT